MTEPQCFPLYEGFDLPPIEAMKHNCPMVCSNTGSLYEVVGGAGEYFDPTSISCIINATKSVVYSSTRQIDLCKKGEKRVEFVSWEVCAKETTEVYKSNYD